MIDSTPRITALLRAGARLTLQVSEERATIGGLVVDWATAQCYVRRLRQGNQPALERQVVIEYPGCTIPIKDEN